MEDFMTDLLLDIGFPEELIKDIFDAKLYYAQSGFDGSSMNVSFFINPTNYAAITYTSPPEEQC